MISLKSWMFCCVRIQNIFTCESFANFLTAYKSGVRPTDRHLMENKIWRLFHAGTELLFQISPDGVKRGHFAQIDTLTMELPFVTSRTCTFYFPVDVCAHFVELVGYFSPMIFSPCVTALGRRQLARKIYISTLLKVQSTIWTEPDVANKYISLFNKC